MPFLWPSPWHEGGEGGSSLGEWHEAINLCAARRLPAIFCVQNNQTALSTPVPEQSSVRVFADKAAGYGIPGITLDGTDPEAIAAAFQALLPQVTRLVAVHFQRTLVSRALNRLHGKEGNEALEAALAATESANLEIAVTWR